MEYIPVKLNYKYYPRVYYKKNIDPCSRCKVADELIEKLRNLIAIYRKNLQYAQKLQKRVYDKRTKPRSYAFSRKVWLNSKYIKTKHNWKLETRFLGCFRVLHLVGSQAYKLQLSKQWRIHKVFHISPLEKNITKKERVDKKTAKQLKFEDGGNNKEYKMKSICDSTVYARELEAGYLPSFYYLIF